MESYRHDTGSFTGKGGVEIFFQKWIVDKAKAVMIIVHGIGEHSGRYENLLNSLAGKKISIYAMDMRGHGNSDGKRGHIDSFMDYVYDLKLFLEYIKEENRGNPIILYGHSMGGVIAAKYAMTYPEDISMLSLSSPAFALAVNVPGWKKSLAEFFSSRMGSLALSNGISAEDLSHDTDIVSAYENDPLVHNKVSARWFVEFTKTGQECLDNASSIKKPLILFHSKNDFIADCNAAEKFYNSVSSASKKIFIYDGLFHEMINEKIEDREMVLKDVTGWILRSIDSSPVQEKKVMASKDSKPKQKVAAKEKATPVKKSATKTKTKVKAKAKAKPEVKMTAKTPVKKSVVKKSNTNRTVPKPAVKSTTKKSAKKIKKR